MANYTMPTNITNFQGILSYPNLVTNELFGLVLTLVIWIIVFSAFKSKSGTEDAMVGASFITFVIVTTGALIGMMSYTIVLAPLFLIALALFIKRKSLF